MQIAVCSDIHDNIWALERALAQMQDAEALLFCGDLCAPFTLAQLAAGLTAPIHVVWGSNDGDKLLLSRQAGRSAHVQLHGELAQVELDGVRIGVNHYPEIARRLVTSGAYDLVCYGHDHTPLIEPVGAAMLLNPGEVMGRFGEAGWVLYDAETGSFQRYLI